MIYKTAHDVVDIVVEMQTCENTGDTSAISCKKIVREIPDNVLQE